MNITHPTHQSPLKRNGATAYLRRYLDTLSDWQTYAGLDISQPDALSQTVRRVTADFFSPARLKGVSLLLAAHLAQQAVSATATALTRSLVRGAPLDTVRGIRVRRSPLTDLWPRLCPAWLAPHLTIADSYYFHEGGRTWHVTTLRLPARTLSVLSLLSLPNRACYFDRPLDYPTAVPLALGLHAPDTVDGFLGDTNELDALIPILRVLKLALYLLNWLLVDPAERDAHLPDPTPYSDLTPAPTAGHAAPAGPPPPQPPGGFYHGYAPPTPNGFPAYGLPWHAPAAPPATTLLEQPVSVLITLDGREQWHTIARRAVIVRTAAGHDTGLALTPAIEALADGRLVEHDTRWNVTHLGSGRQLNTSPLTSRDRAQALAAALTVIDWNRAVEDIPPTDLDRARAIIGGHHVQ